MDHKITIIGLPMPFHLGSVNCYLIQSGEGYLLIDTGMPAGRNDLERHSIARDASRESFH